MADALTKAGIVLPQLQQRMVPLRNPKRRRWGKSIEKRAIEWSHELFGTVQISCRGFKVGSVRQEGINSWARVYRSDQEPDRIRLDFYTDLEEDVYLLQSKKGVFEDMTDQDLLPFDVKVAWKEIRVKGEREYAPTTRRTDEDNFDLFFLRQDGKFVQLQIALVGRNGQFWVTIQEIYGGYVVEVPEEAIGKFERDTLEHNRCFYAIVPAYGENAYPGADYLSGASRREATGLIDHVARCGAFVPFSQAEAAEWEPQELEDLPESMTSKGWRKGVVKFFNLVIGWGFVTVEENGEPKDVFVHFSSIIDENGQPIASKGEFPVLQPMVGVALKYKIEDGKRKATAVLTA